MRSRRIAGRYELLEQLGGSTWRAADTELQRDVLVQVPAGDVAATTLAHPGIVHVFDQGVEDGEPYAVFEYVPGGTLEQRLAAGSLTEAEVERVAADVTSALAYAHAEGVTHGSLGPATILLDDEGRAKVAGSPAVARRRRTSARSPRSCRASAPRRQRLVRTPPSSCRPRLHRRLRLSRRPRAGAARSC
jgi:serine/threonine protein kinase